MNEELQSSNEELETSNEELRQRTLEVHDMNLFLETVLSAIGLAVAAIDGEQRVQVWNSQARELWGLTLQETLGKHLLSLDIGLPVERLKAPLRACLTGASAREESVLEATNRRGKQFECRVTCLPRGSGDNGLSAGVIIMMEPSDNQRQT